MKKRLLLIVCVLFAVLCSSSCVGVFNGELECEVSVYKQGETVEAEGLSIKHSCSKIDENCDLKDRKIGFGIENLKHGIYNIVSDLSIALDDDLSIPVQICVNYFHTGDRFANVDLKYNVYVETTEEGVSVKTIIDYQRANSRQESFESTKIIDIEKLKEPYIFTFGFGS